MKKQLLVQKDVSAKTGSVSSTSIYDVVYDEKGNDVRLKYSPVDSSWTSPGKNAATLKSDGNGYKVKLSQAKGQPMKELYLDYSQADYLFHLLEVNRKLYRRSRKDLEIKEVYMTKKQFEKENDLLPEPGQAAKILIETTKPVDAYKTHTERPKRPIDYKSDGDDNNVLTKYMGPEVTIGDAMKVILKQMTDMVELDGLQKHEVLGLIKASLDEHIEEVEE
jgi:hypothetical protein